MLIGLVFGDSCLVFRVLCLVFVVLRLKVQITFSQIVASLHSPKYNHSLFVGQ